MSSRFSVYLDAVRSVAAFVVFLSHFAYPRFTDGEFIWIRVLNLGSDAVVVFFVLSGLVIAYSVDVKDRTLMAYAFSRATRIYSVVLPAVALTVLFDAAGQAIDPVAYDGWWYHSAPLHQIVLRSVSFTNEWGFHSFRIGSNGPLWSVSYEVWYYVLFGVVCFCSRRSALLLVLLLAAIIGPKILLLMPVWLAGVAAYRVIRRSPPPSRMSSALLAIVPPVVYVLCLSGGLPAHLLELTSGPLGDAVVPALGFSDEFAWNALVGAIVALHFIGIAGLLGGGGGSFGAVGKAIRWLAGASFSLYVVHYPALQLFDAALPAGLAPELRHTLLLACTLGTCFAFAELFERRLGAFRELLRRLVSAALGSSQLPWRLERPRDVAGSHATRTQAGIS